MVAETASVFVGGYIAMKSFEYLKRKARDVSGKAWWVSLRTISFPVVLLAFTYTSDVSISHRILAGFVAFLMMPILSVLRPATWEGHAAFGVRGCILALFAVTAIKTVLLGNSPQDTMQVLHYLSLLSFAMAAWNTNVLASTDLWENYPEVDPKCNIFFAVQLYSGLGFLFSYLAHNLASVHSS